MLSGNVFFVIFKPKHGQLSCSLVLPFALLFLSHTCESVNTAPFPRGGVFSSPFLSVFVSGLRQTSYAEGRLAVGAGSRVAAALAGCLAEACAGWPSAGHAC